MLGQRFTIEGACGSRADVDQEFALFRNSQTFDSAALVANGNCFGSLRGSKCLHKQVAILGPDIQCRTIIGKEQRRNGVIIVERPDDT